MFLFSLSFIVLACNKNSNREDNLLQDLMEQEPDKFSDIIRNKDPYEIQIIYTQIDRDAANKPSFSSHYFNVDSTRYFYPASTVKLPMVLLSLEKLRNLNIRGLDLHTPMFHDSVYHGQISVRNDSTSENGLPSVSHYSKKILVVSDNDAFNRLYEFMGQQAIDENLKKKGYESIRILHRLDRSLSQNENRHTEAVKFVKDGLVVYQQPGLINDKPIIVNKKILKGKGFIRNDSLIQKPFDFTDKNFYPLTSQQHILRSIIFPESVNARNKFNISEEDRKFVLKYMSQLPTETKFPDYNSDTTYYDAYCKFLVYGGERGEMLKNIRIFNKVGDAYGYLIDNAYVVDFENKVEFMLSAVINTNTDSIYNDSKYEYEKLGFPFMKNLGKLIYDYELKRNKKYPPDLSAFVLKYDR